MKIISLFLLLFSLASCNKSWYNDSSYEHSDQVLEDFTEDDVYVESEYFDIKEVTLIEYTGKDKGSEHVKPKKKIISHGDSKWVKTKADKNCLSPNPDDCMVWCLQVVPEKSISYYAVTDTMFEKDFVVETRTYGLVKQRSGMKWVKIYDAEAKALKK